MHGPLILSLAPPRSAVTADITDEDDRDGLSSTDANAGVAVVDDGDSNGDVSVVAGPVCGETVERLGRPNIEADVCWSCIVVMTTSATALAIETPFMVGWLVGRLVGMDNLGCVSIAFDLFFCVRLL